MQDYIHMRGQQVPLRPNRLAHASLDAIALHRMPSTRPAVSPTRATGQLIVAGRAAAK